MIEGYRGRDWLDVLQGTAGSVNGESIHWLRDTFRGEYIENWTHKIQEEIFQRFLVKNSLVLGREKEKRQSLSYSGP